MSFCTPIKATGLWVALLLSSTLLFSCEDAANNDTTTEPTMGNDVAAPTVEPRQTLERLGYNDCDITDLSCACDYKLKGEGNDAGSFFVSDMGGEACVKIAGDVVKLKSKSGEYRMQLQERVDYAKENQDWIILPKQGQTLFFGAPVPADKDKLEYLTHILMLLDNIPAEVPIRNESEGMAVREVRDLTADAVVKAKARQANSDYELSEEDVYYNEAYQVVVETENMTNYEGEADTYEGTLTLKDKAGNILHVQPVSGTCGC
jgi:hypothetical protein